MNALLIRVLSLIVTLLGAIAPGHTATVVNDSKKHSVLVIMFDGFRWDHVGPERAPNLDKLAKAGVRGEMIPVWPTISAPNHWALITGLHPEHSAIFHNENYNPAVGRTYTPGEDRGALGETIWAAVTRKGGVSGVIGGWAGAQNADNPLSRPSFYIPYSAVPGADNRHDLVLSILDQEPARRPDLLALYVIEIDHAQHQFGVDSPEARAAIAAADTMLGKIIAGLAARDLSATTDIVIVADHGQMNVARDQNIALDTFVDADALVTPPVGGGPVYALWTKPGMDSAVRKRLKGAHRHLHVYGPGEVPARWRCCHPDRMPPLLVVTDPGWSMVWRQADAGAGHAVQGNHGFDNAERAMHAAFVAAGPSIRTGATVAPFSAVDVHPFLATLLNVPPGQTDGSIRSLCPVLARQPQQCVKP